MMSIYRRIDPLLVLLLFCIFFISACGPSPEEPTATPTMGVITGLVLDKEGKPLANISDQETLIVVLFCRSDDSDTECLHSRAWEMGPTFLFDHICEAGDTASKCLLHIGQGAVYVAADGSYAINDIPPGKYQLIFVYKNSEVTHSSREETIELAQAGEIIKFDIKTSLPGK